MRLLFNMPNTRSAIRRTRNNARRAAINRRTKTRLKTLETKFTTTVQGGKRDDAQQLFRLVSSTLDKAAKTGVIHQGKADRKKSRLATCLGAMAS